MGGSADQRATGIDRGDGQHPPASPVIAATRLREGSVTSARARERVASPARRVIPGPDGGGRGPTPPQHRLGLGPLSLTPADVAQQPSLGAPVGPDGPSDRVTS